MIVQEFYLQGEEEKRLGIPVSPSMDRETTSQAKISIQFNDLIASPYFEALGDILNPMECFVDLLRTNRIEWISLMDVSKEVKFIDEQEDVTSPETEEIAKIRDSASKGRRMSTAAGTIDIPILTFRALPSRHKRHRFILLLISVSVLSLHPRRKMLRCWVLPSRTKMMHPICNIFI